MAYTKAPSAEAVKSISALAGATVLWFVLWKVVLHFGYSGPYPMELLLLFSLPALVCGLSGLVVRLVAGIFMKKLQLPIPVGFWARIYASGLIGSCIIFTVLLPWLINIDNPLSATIPLVILVTTPAVIQSAYATWVYHQARVQRDIVDGP